MSENKRLELEITKMMELINSIHFEKIKNYGNKKRKIRCINS